MPKCKSSTTDSEARKSTASPTSARTQLTSPSTISLTSTHTSAAMPPPCLTFASLGLEPAAEHTFHSGHAATRPHMAVLKFAVIEELHEFIIFFQFVPDAEPSGNYSEMFMFTAVKNNEAIFCDHLNVSRTWHSIYENNEASLNSAGYSFRAFNIVTKTKPMHQVLINLGEAICQTLNAIC